MANKKFEDYVIAGDNITLTYDNNADTVTIDAAGNVDSVNGKVGVVVLDKTDIGLGNVDNTSDVNKPISSATQTALNSKQDSLGFIPVTNARTLTINGTSYDLSANRSWTVGDLVSSGSYSNPSWLTALAWGKITSTPTTLNGYGITDAVNTGSSYADPSWITSLAFSKITGYSTPTLAQVTTAGNTTTNAITVGGLTVATSLIYTDTVNSRVGIGTVTPTTGHLMTVNGNILITNALLQVNRNLLPHISMNSSGVNYGLIQNQSSSSWSLAYGSASNSLGTAVLTWFGATGNVGINTTTDAGYKLDVNGTARISGNTTITMNSPSSWALYINYSTNIGHAFTPTNAKLYRLNITGNYQSGAVGDLNPILNVGGSVTSASAIARGVYFNNTLVAAANNDVLVGLDINPTFTNGAFTGVKNYALRISGRVNITSLPTSSTGLSTGDLWNNGGIINIV